MGSLEDQSHCFQRTIVASFSHLIQRLRLDVSTISTMYISTSTSTSRPFQERKPRLWGCGKGMISRRGLCRPLRTISPCFTSSTEKNSLEISITSFQNRYAETEFKILMWKLYYPLLH